MGTSKLIESSAAFLFEVPEQSSPLVVQELQIGGTRPGRKVMSRRIRVMIVLLENNTAIEPEISALCPALTPLVVARVKRPPRTVLLEDLPAYAEATLEAIEPFAASGWGPKNQVRD
jgi:hypothetical protein